MFRTLSAHWLLKKKKKRNFGFLVPRMIFPVDCVSHTKTPPNKRPLFPKFFEPRFFFADSLQWERRVYPFPVGRSGALCAPRTRFRFWIRSSCFKRWVTVFLSYYWPGRRRSLGRQVKPKTFTPALLPAPPSAEAGAPCTC